MFEFIIFTIVASIVIVILVIATEKQKQSRDNAWKTTTPLVGVVMPKSAEEREKDA